MNIIILISLLTLTIAHCDEIFVSLNGEDNSGCGSEENPCASLKQAISIASNGSLILMEPGVYTGQNNANIEIRNIELEIRSIAGSESTIIDCSYSFNNGECIFGYNSNITLEGLTIRNGTFIEFNNHCSLSMADMQIYRISYEFYLNNFNYVVCNDCQILGTRFSIQGHGTVDFYNCTFSNNTNAVFVGYDASVNLYNATLFNIGLGDISGYLRCVDCVGYSSSLTVSQGGYVDLINCTFGESSSRFYSQKGNLNIASSVFSGFSGNSVIYAELGAVITLENVTMTNCTTGIATSLVMATPVILSIENSLFKNMQVGMSLKSTFGNISNSTFISLNQAIVATFVFSSVNISVSACYFSEISGTVISSSVSLMVVNSLFTNNGGYGISVSQQSTFFPYIFVSDSSFIENNNSAIIVSGSFLSVDVYYTLFQANYAYSGAAIQLNGMNTKFHCHYCNCTNNQATLGGAISSNGSYSTIIITYSTFESNFGTEGGGSISTQSPVTMSISNSNFKSNGAGIGGALMIYSGSNVNITKSTFDQNNATYGPDAAFLSLMDDSTDGTNLKFYDYHEETLYSVIVNGPGTTIQTAQNQLVYNLSLCLPGYYLYSKNPISCYPCSSGQYSFPLTDNYDSCKSCPNNDGNDCASIDESNTDLMYTVFEEYAPSPSYTDVKGLIECLSYNGISPCKELKCLQYCDAMYPTNCTNQCDNEDGVCKTGYTNRMCSQCTCSDEECYTFSPSNGCTKCESPSKVKVTLSAVAYSIALIGFIVSPWSPIIFVITEIITFGILLSLGAMEWWLTSSICFALINVTIAIGKKTFTSSSQESTNNNGFGMIKILIFYLQTVESLISSSFWPSSLKKLEHVFAISNMQSSGLECIVGNTAMDTQLFKFLFNMFFPIVLFFIILILLEVRVISVKLLKAIKGFINKDTRAYDQEEIPLMENTPAETISHSPNKSMYKYLFYYIVLTSYYGLTTQVLTIYNCTKDPFSNLYYMTALPWMECDMQTNSTYFPLFSFALLFTILYIIGIPALFGFILWKYSDSLNQDKVKNVYGFIYSNYKPNYFWWELVWSGRRVLLALAISVISVDSGFQTVAIQVILLGSLVIQVVTKPFGSMMENIYETTSLSIILVTYSQSVGLDITPGLSWTMAVINLLLLCSFGITTLIFVYQQYSSQICKSCSKAN